MTYAVAPQNGGLILGTYRTLDEARAHQFPNLAVVPVFDSVTAGEPISLLEIETFGL